MTTTIVFESATLIDVIKKAARIAPSKAGSAFDKAWGILMQVTPGEEVKCLVRATNLDVFYTEIVGCVSAEGDDAVWRMPSQLLASTLGNLPIGSGKQIKIHQDGPLEKIQITSGRMKANVNLGDAAYYHEWDMFATEEMFQVTGLGGRIGMVEWAADTGQPPPYCGVWIDGEYLTATNRYVLARVPMEIPDLPRPIVVPAGILGSSLKTMGDTAVAVSETQLELMPDDFTQIATVTYDVGIPSMDRITSFQYPVEVEVPKTLLLDMLNRASQFAGADRSPLLKTFFGRGEIAAMMENDEVGLIGDVVEVPGEIDHKRVEIRFNPKYLISALSHAPGERVTLGYDPGDPMRFFYVQGDAGYQSWVVPLKEVKPGT